MKISKNILQSHLLVQLDDDLYAINVINVNQIIGIPAITKIPQTPLYMKGLMNTRESLIPVIDLRVLYGMKAVPYSKNTAIVIAECSCKNEAGNKFQNLGLLVDAVHELREIDSTTVEQPLIFKNGDSNVYFSGFVHIDDKIAMILDIDKLFKSESIIQLESYIKESHSTSIK